jgi:hypothetical protein
VIAMTVTVTDSFEIRPGMAGTSHAPGVIVVFDPSRFGQNVPSLGTRMTVRSPDGRVVPTVLGELKHHGRGMSFFFADLTTNDAPIGSEIQWQEIVAPKRMRSKAS